MYKAINIFAIIPDDDSKMNLNCPQTKVYDTIVISAKKVLCAMTHVVFIFILNKFKQAVQCCPVLCQNDEIQKKWLKVIHEECTM